MSRPNEDRLVAYLDGEMDAAERREIEAWLDSDPATRDTMTALVRSAALLREAYADVLREPLPERLIAAARGEASAEAPAQILAFTPRRGAPRTRQWSGWRMALPVAATLFGLVFGSGAGYFGTGRFVPIGAADNSPSPAVAATMANNLWLDNAAGYFKLFASAGDNALIDVPASGDAREALQKISQSLTQAVRLPDLKPWGLNFRGARLVVVDGHPAAQLVYTTDNKAIGPMALIIGSSKQPDIPPTFDRRQDVNMLYWRHQGRAYVLVGQADAGYLWGIGNDVAWQLDAI
jgi:anti-sigma factor RsiW